MVEEDEVLIAVSGGNYKDISNDVIEEVEDQFDEELMDTSEKDSVVQVEQTFEITPTESLCDEANIVEEVSKSEWIEESALGPGRITVPLKDPGLEAGKLALM